LVTRSGKRKLLWISGVKPRRFEGEISLPPSKSYLHRALFVASLQRGTSQITGCGTVLSEDVKATIRFLRSLGVKISRGHKETSGVNADTTLLVSAREGLTSPKEPVFLGGSGTTARFAIAFAALANDLGTTKLVGDASLSKRPMQPLLDALVQLGVRCKSERGDGRLPVLVRGGGIQGGTCVIDGSISSQFISSLIIAGVKARRDTTIEISDSSRLVSEPYIEATIGVLDRYGFKVDVKRHGGGNLEFKIRARQVGLSGTSFPVPGDMSSASSLIGATLCAAGDIRLTGISESEDLPQPDSRMLEIAKSFGAGIESMKGGVSICATSLDASRKRLNFDLGDSPDLVPVVFATAAGLGVQLDITNIAHLRFKESDRIHTLAREFKKLGLITSETRDSISLRGRKIGARRRKIIFLNPKNDHRMLMAFTIAGVSGNLGEFYIYDPECVNKSYPAFISDLKRLTGGKRTIKIVSNTKGKEGIVDAPKHDRL